MSGRLNSDKEKAIKILEYCFLVELLNQKNLGEFKEKGNKASRYKKELISGNTKKHARFWRISYNLRLKIIYRLF